MIGIRKLNEVAIIIDTDEPGIIHEIADYFTFTVPGHQFMPTFRNKMWDGKIRLYSHTNKTLYAGLLNRLEQFAEERNYPIHLDQSIERAKEFSSQKAKQFIKQLNLAFSMRDYQMKAFIHAVRNRRCLILSPTASGKSLIIYSFIRYHRNKRCLIIVPTISLVAQLHSDFDIYGGGNWNARKNIHCIMEGKTKETDKPITIATWQSIYKMPKKYFDQFDVVVGDECHLFKAKSLTSIMTKLTKAKYRIGTTGTLDGTETHQLILEGLFGPVKQITTTKELIDSKQLSDFHIKALTLRYSEEERKRMVRSRYQDEIDFIVTHKKRNNFIRNLTVSLEGNTLVLFQYVEKHGKPLYENIKNAIDVNNRKLFFVYGGTDVDQRERVRALVENENNAIIVASNGVYSTGVNIKRLHNIIFTHPGKSKIRTLQSIGRGLRTGKDKTSATLYDIVDDLGYKTYKNFATKHFLERYKHYMDEKFDVKIYKIDLN